MELVLVLFLFLNILCAIWMFSIGNFVVGAMNVAAAIYITTGLLKS